MPTSPKLFTCFGIASQITFTVALFWLWKRQWKILQNPNEVQCTEQNTTFILNLFRCNTMIVSINYKNFHATLPKLFTCFGICPELNLVWHYSGYKRGIEKTFKITKGFGALIITQHWWWIKFFQFNETSPASCSELDQSSLIWEGGWCSYCA